MNGFIEIKENDYHNTLEHLYKIKMEACELIKKMTESSELYDRNYDDMPRGYRNRYNY